MTKSKAGSAYMRASTESFAPHIVTLAAQATDEVRQLWNALDAHLALDHFLIPENEADRMEFLTRLAGFATLKHSLNDELWRLLNALSNTTTRLYMCAAEEARRN